jgi:hypothetical protein
LDDFDKQFDKHLRRKYSLSEQIKKGQLMNRVCYFARRIISIVALAMLVTAGWPQTGHAQPTGMEPHAEKLLRRMSDYLAGRQQFTLKAESTLEVMLTSGQKLQYDSPATLMCRDRTGCALTARVTSPTRNFSTTARP